MAKEERGRLLPWKRTEGHLVEVSQKAIRENVCRIYFSADYARPLRPDETDPEERIIAMLENSIGTHFSREIDERGRPFWQRNESQQATRGPWRGIIPGRDDHLGVREMPWYNSKWGIHLGPEYMNGVERYRTGAHVFVKLAYRKNSHALGLVSWRRDKRFLRTEAAPWEIKNAKSIWFIGYELQAQVEV